MKKYEIIKNGVDDYTLKYKDKEIKFNSSVGIAEKLQSATKTGRVNMYIELSKQGITSDQLSTEEKKDGKTYVNDSNKKEIEKIFIQEAQAQIFLEAIEEMLNIKYEELIKEIGFNTQEEVEEFSTEIGKIMVGQSPSGK